MPHNADSFSVSFWFKRLKCHGGIFEMGDSHDNRLTLSLNEWKIVYSQINKSISSTPVSEYPKSSFNGYFIGLVPKNEWTHVYLFWIRY